MHKKEENELKLLQNVREIKCNYNIIFAQHCIKRILRKCLKQNINLNNRQLEQNLLYIF